MTKQLDMDITIKKTCTVSEHENKYYIFRGKFESDNAL
jgi:hypothetical protein